MSWWRGRFWSPYEGRHRSTRPLFNVWWTIRVSTMGLRWRATAKVPHTSNITNQPTQLLREVPA